VLRPLNSFNFKGDADGVEPKPVKLISVVDPIPFGVIRDIVGVSQGETVKPRRPMSAMGKALMQNNDSVFSKIMQLTGKGEGCNQLAACYTDRATLVEPSVGSMPFPLLSFALTETRRYTSCLKGTQTTTMR
jgi:hypothetical protein